MKTAISIPDDTFSEVEHRARALGMSRSEFYTVAARHYLHELDETVTTRQINDALATLATDDSGAAAVAAGRRRIAAGDEDW